MDPLVTASLVGAGSDLIGGLIGSKGSSSNKSVKLMEAQARVQRGLWEDQLPSLVKGAKTAGLHPLVAAGVSPASGPSIPMIGDDGASNLAAGFSNMGQNLGRAVAAHQTEDERSSSQIMQALAVERAALENQLLKHQVTSVNQPTTIAYTGGRDIIPGQGDGAVVVVPDEVTSRAKGDSGLKAGNHPAFQSYSLGRGRTVQLPVSDGGIGEALEGLPWPYAWAKMAEMLYKRYDAYTPGYTLSRFFKKFKRR